MGIASWIGAGIGWAFGGPIGALIGYSLGSWIGANASEVKQLETGTRGNRRRQTTTFDFKASLLVLTAAVMKADGKVLKSELDFVKEFFKNNFGIEQTKRDMLLLRDLLEKDIPVYEVADQIRRYMPMANRLQLLYYLVGLAKSDQHLDQKEETMIRSIAMKMGINQYDINSVFATREPQSRTTNYQILEISPSATNDEVKKAYRRMARKFHPDKVANLGEEAMKSAEEKFKKVKSAYEAIKKERGMR